MIIELAGLVIEAKCRWRFSYDKCSEYLYNGDKKPDFSVFVTDEELEEEKKKTPQSRYESLEYYGLYKKICERVPDYNAILLHSAVISVDNKAYMFSANSGTGKTTHMNLWLEKFGKRAFVVNGDKPIVRCIGDEFYAFGTPWCGKENLQKNIGVPLKGICILERSENNTIRRADNKEALLFLLTQTLQQKNKNIYIKTLDNLGKIIENVPVYKLGCNMEPEACEVAYNAMNQD